MRLFSTKRFFWLITMLLIQLLLWTFMHLDAFSAGSLRQSGATFVVETVGDAGDSSPGNGLCASSSGVCTLRAALEEANALPGHDTITFNIPGAGPHTLQPTSPLPDITEAVTLDATTQPGYTPTTPQIELSGLAAGSAVSGLVITAGGTAVRGLVINHFYDAGLLLDGGAGYVITGNFLGTDPGGTLPRDNGAGLVLLNVTNSTIGGTTAAARNLISGNFNAGLILDENASGNVIQGNVIGTTLDGTAVLANGNDGIRFYDAFNNTIGGVEPGAGNLISGNGDDGIDIEGSVVVTGNVILGNIIGTDVTGQFMLSNGDEGIVLTDVAAHTIGSPAAGGGNLVSGNNDNGILLDGATGVLVLGNRIGVNATGDTAVPNANAGIRLANNAGNNTIGGPEPGAGNLISGNDNDGISIFNTAVGNTIQGNRIGTDASGLAPLGNADDGLVLDNARNQLIGGTGPGAGNIIAGNGGAGVYIRHNNSKNNSVLGNAITGNADLGIDLRPTGVTANDSGDGDTGVNNLQNYPVLSAASSSQTAVTITGTLNSKANTAYTVEFFANNACDPSGHGQGERFLGRTTVSTDGSGNTGFVTTLAGESAGGAFVTATATDPQGNTSEFSGCVETAVGQPARTWQLIPTVNTPPVVGEYAMAYDSSRDVVVLVGGNATGWPYESATWEFDGADWTQQQTAQQPEAVYGAALVYDANRGVTILFGGSNAADDSLNQTWEYNGTNWTQIATPASPPARTYHDMVYDPATRQVFLFGGRQGTIGYEDTWRYDGTTWSHVTPAGASPPARSLHALALNPQENMVLLFGGRDAAGALLADLWTLDLSTFTWSQVNTTGPAARQAHRLLYDPLGGHVMLLGGANNDSDLLLADIWHYHTQVGWAQASLPVTPGASAYHALVYDEAHTAVILFANGQTWQYK